MLGGILGSLLGGGISVGGSGGSAGAAGSVGGNVYNSADIVFSGGTDAGISGGSSSSGITASSWFGPSLVIAAVAAGWLLARR